MHVCSFLSRKKCKNKRDTRRSGRRIRKRKHRGKSGTRARTSDEPHSLKYSYKGTVSICDCDCDEIEQPNNLMLLRTLCGNDIKIKEEMLEE